MRDLSKAALLVAALVGLSVWLGWKPERSGSPYVIDGDTIVLSDHRIRLAGIDAPELGQTCGPAERPTPCGRLAREALLGLVSGRAVACRIEGRDRWSRDLARCRVGETDLGAELVRRGFAIAYGAYEAEEREAREASAGLWAAPFERPGDWRRRHASPPRP